MPDEILATVDQSYLHPSGEFTVYRLVVRFPSRSNMENIAFKRFSDFITLHRRLARVHKAFNVHNYFPPLTKHHHFNRFNPRLIEKRRQALDAFVKFITLNRHLYCHTYFARFIAAGVLNEDSPSDKSVIHFNRSVSNSEASSSLIPFINSDSLFALDGLSDEKSISRLPADQSLSRRLESPLSSDVDSECEGDTLPLVWMRSETQRSKIVDEIVSARVHFIEKNWCEAYRGYKDAVSNLLQVINSNPVTEGEYRGLLAACLSKVEYIYRKHFGNNVASSNKKNDLENNKEKSLRPSWLESPKLASLCQDPALSIFFGSPEELFKFKICAIDGKDLVVCDSADTSMRFTLKSRCVCVLAGIHSECPTIASTNFESSRVPQRILPIGQVPFMSPLHRLVETADRSRVFLLVKRPRGELRLVDWLSDYLHERIRTLLRSKDSISRKNLGLAFDHLNWCKVRSSRIREMFRKSSDHSLKRNVLEQKSFPNASSRSANLPNDSSTSSLDELGFGNSTFLSVRQSNCFQNQSIKSCRVLSSLLRTPNVVLKRHPLHIHYFSPTKSRSNDQINLLPIFGEKKDPLSLTDDDSLDHTYENTMQVFLLPEKRFVLWAAQLVSVVSWLHEHHIMLRHLNRSNIYLNNQGKIEIDYFFRWIDDNKVDENTDPMSCAPELLIGDLSRDFLCSMSWEKCVACDWWSVGVILYEIFTGVQLSEVYPYGLSCDKSLQFPSTLSANVKGFLSKLLKLNPNKRLSGADVKNHPVFAFVDWKFVEESGLM